MNFKCTWTASVLGIAVVSAAIEAVVIVCVTDLVIAFAFNIINADREGLALSSVSVAEVLCVTVSVIVTFAGVVNQVTDWSRILTVEAAVMAS